jgi:hypothetical protein
MYNHQSDTLMLSRALVLVDANTMNLSAEAIELTAHSDADFALIVKILHTF